MLASTGVESTTDADARLLAAAADPTRLAIVRQLAAAGETCVCNLAVAPDVPGNLLSYHLRILREVGLVSARRDGRRVYYSVATSALEHLRSAIPAPGRRP